MSLLRSDLHTVLHNIDKWGPRRSNQTEGSRELLQVWCVCAQGDMIEQTKKLNCCKLTCKPRQHSQVVPDEGGGHASITTPQINTDSGTLRGWKGTHILTPVMPTSMNAEVPDNLKYLTTCKTLKLKRNTQHGIIHSRVLGHTAEWCNSNN